MCLFVLALVCEKELRILEVLIVLLEDYNITLRSCYICLFLLNDKRIIEEKG